MKILKPITLNDTSTFTRASTAHYFDSGGLLRVANNNVLRLDYDPSLAEGEGTFLVESAATNLLSYPRNFDNSFWGKTGVVAVPNTAVSPSGAMGACFLMEDATNGNHNINTASFTPSANTTYTAWSFFKASNSRSHASINAGTLANWTAGFAAFFNLANGTIVSTQGGAVATIQHVSNGWYLCTCTMTSVAIPPGGAVIRFMVNDATSATSYVGTAGSGIYIWHAQLESGTKATSIIPDATAFVSRASSGTFIGSNGLIQTAGTNVARMQYNPLNLSADPFLLLEAAATNFLLRSEEFDNAVWGKPNTTVTANSTVAPDGATTADKFVPNAGAIQCWLSQSYAASANTAYTLSAFVKSAGMATIRLNLFTNETGDRFADFNLTTGAASNVSSGITVASVNCGNGWWRLAITLTTASTATSFVTNPARLPSGVGDGVSGVYIWGAQLEVGSFATSYIATTSAQVTRAADISTSPQATRAADILGTMNSIMTNNVPETENTAWSASTVYKLGDIVRYVAPNIHKLYQSLTGSQATVTMTIAAPCVVTWAGHGHAADTPIVFSTTGALPTGITAGTVYYILAPTANTFNIAATPGGAAINTTGTQSGVHTATASNNFNKNPTTNPTIWQDIGSTNTWKMFDQSVQSQTIQLSNIRTDILLNSSLTNTVTLLNIATKTARVTMKHPVDGLVYDQEKTIRSYFGVTDWYQYFYHSFQKDTDLLFESIPPYPNATLTIDLNDSGNTVKCGVAVIGNAIDTSADKKGVEHGARIGIQDYSVKSQDDFGNYTIVERNFARRTDFTVYTEPEEMNGLVNLLASLRATPTIYIASGENKHTCMITYGFYKDFTVEVAYPTYSICTIQLEGLT